jgi:hypothetical protein
MGFSPTSFLLGLGAAWLLPLVTRVFRPLAVEATAAGMAVFEGARRAAAEQMETLEDIVAEARARAEAVAAEADGDVAEEVAEATGEEPVDDPRPRRRPARREPSVTKP